MYSSNLRLKYLFATYRLIEVHHMNMCDICLFYSQRKNTLKCILYYIKYFIQTLLNECRTKIIHIMTWCEIKLLLTRTYIFYRCLFSKFDISFPRANLNWRGRSFCSDVIWRHDSFLCCVAVSAHTHIHTQQLKKIITVRKLLIIKIQHD